MITYHTESTSVFTVHIKIAVVCLHFILIFSSWFCLYSPKWQINLPEGASQSLGMKLTCGSTSMMHIRPRLSTSSTASVLVPYRWPLCSPYSTNLNTQEDTQQGCTYTSSYKCKSGTVHQVGKFNPDVWQNKITEIVLKMETGSTVASKTH